MAAYLVGQGSYYYQKHLYRPGDTVMMPNDARPPAHLTPVDEAAKTAYAKAHTKQVPQSPPPAPSKKSEPVEKFVLGSK